MFGVAPQFSGWLKERQTRKGATSATTCPVQEKNTVEERSLDQETRELTIRV